MITGNEPAMPAMPTDNEMLQGLTIRQEFAKTAMLGLLSKYNLNTPEDQTIICKLSVELADELIKRLNAK